MTETRFNPRHCSRCGQKKNELREGREVIVPCNCDWERGFQTRMRNTVHGQFFHKSMRDWSPKIFRGEVAGAFPRLVKVQKAQAIKKVYEFAFRRIPASPAPVDGLQWSIANQLNLFVRGPEHSGRGLITAAIKILAATRDISTTPNPGDFDIFKSELVETEAFHSTEARALAFAKYESVKLLALENVRGETFYKWSGEKTAKTSRAAASIDKLLSMRLHRSGAMLLSGPDFVGQIGETQGDRLASVLESDKTSVVLLFTPEEADALLNGLKKFRDTVRDNFKAATSVGLNGGKWSEGSLEREAAERVREALYFEEAFKDIPQGFGDAGGKEVAFFDALGFCAAKLPKRLTEVVRSFAEGRQTNGLEFKKGVNGVLSRAAKECCDVVGKMSDKEMLEAGRLMSIATAPKEAVQAEIDEAKRLRDEMSGLSSDI